MRIPADKRAYLVAALGEAEVKRLEAGEDEVKDLLEKLEDSEIQFKTDEKKANIVESIAGNDVTWVEEVFGIPQTQEEINDEIIERFVVF